MAILDAATGSLLTRTTLPDPALQLADDGPLGRIHVLTIGNAVATIDTASGRILAVTPVGVTTSNDSRIGGRLLGLDPRAGRLFVVCPPSQSVSVPCAHYREAGRPRGSGRRVRVGVVAQSSATGLFPL